MKKQWLNVRPSTTAANENGNFSIKIHTVDQLCKLFIIGINSRGVVLHPTFSTNSDLERKAKLELVGGLNTASIVLGIVERISLGSLRQSLRITVALSLILVLFSVSYGVPISQYVSMYSLIYYEQRSLRDRSTTR